jgi:hypothetical protein
MQKGDARKHSAQPLAATKPKRGSHGCLAMSVSGWIRHQEGEPQTTQKTQMARLSGQGARLEAMSLQPAFAFLASFALFAVPLALRRCNRLRAMTLEGYQATQRVIGRLSENHRGLR